MSTDKNPNFRAQLHSYALARIMKHVIGFENFHPEDHAVHRLLIDDSHTDMQYGNFRDRLEATVDEINRLNALNQ